MQSHFRFEVEPAAVPAQQVLRALELLRAVLLPDREAAVLVRLVHLHRGDRRARREPRLLLRRERRESRQFREPREVALPEREVPAVQVQPPAQDVLPRLVDDLPVREVGLRLLLRELVRVATELQVHAELRGLPCEVRHDERVPAVRHQDVRVLRAYDLVDSAQDGLLAPVDFDVVHACPEELVLHPRHARRIVDVEVQEGPFQRRQRIVQGEVLLLRPPCAVRVAHEAHGEDVVLDCVALAEPQIHVVEPMVHVASVGVEDAGDLRQVAVVPRDDLEDGSRVVVLQSDAPLDLAHLAHAVEDLDATPEGGELARRGVQEEGGHEARVHDALRSLLVPEPEDHRVLVVVCIRVDDPSVRGSPPVPSLRDGRVHQRMPGRGPRKCARAGPRAARASSA